MKHRTISRKVQLINDYLRKQGTEKLDPKDLDLLLKEITIMHERAELYIKFLRRRIVVSKYLEKIVSCILDTVENLLYLFVE